MQTSSASASSPASVAAWLRTQYGVGATLSMADFVQAALYAPRVGYYRKERARVGYAEDRDFYTAESLGPVFAELVLAAVGELLPDAPRAYRFVEIGVEHPGGLLGDRAHPFAGVHALGVDEAIELSGPCVVFSNELFDAQPFRRFESDGQRWLEHGVRLAQNSIEPVKIEAPDAPPADLPKPAQAGYIFDYPSGAGALLKKIVSPAWHGLFLAFDYGLDRQTLARFRPNGTARTYFQHTVGDNLLVEPGTRDITHHICWNRLADGLRDAGFGKIDLCSQEALFMRRSTQAIEKIFARSSPRGLHRDLQTLKELLHPENMGRKFQVLSGFRSKNTCQGEENS